MIYSLVTLFSAAPLLAFAYESMLNSSIPFYYPEYKQCSEPWGQDLMITKTICEVGCLMSSVSMGLGGSNIPIDGQESNPGTLNAWLIENGGYTSTNDLLEEVVEKIDPSRIDWPVDGMHKTKDLTFFETVDMINKGRVVIGNVMNGGHFVLLTGSLDDGDSFTVNDSGFDLATYSYAMDVVGFRIYDMVREEE